MVELEVVPQTYDEAVRMLVDWHTVGGEPRDLLVYVFPDPAKEMVRLLEVSDEFPASGEVWAVGFGKSAEFPFVSETALVTQDEWRQIQSGELALPAGWDRSAARQMWPHD